MEKTQKEKTQIESIIRRLEYIELKINLILASLDSRDKLKYDDLTGQSLPMTLAEVWQQVRTNAKKGEQHV